MSIDTCQEQFDQRGGDATGIEIGDDRYFLIKSNDKYDTSISIRDDGCARGLLPNYLSPHPDNVFATCRRLRITQKVGSIWWTAQAEYSTKPLTEDEKEREEPNPLDRRAKISWSTRSYTEPIDKDIDGNPVMNSAGDSFDPPVEREASYWVATVEKNMLAVPTWIIEYENAINESSYNIDGLDVDPECSRLTGLSISERLEENNVTYRRVGFQIEFRAPPNGENYQDGGETNDPITPKGWTKCVLDEGLRHVPYRDENGDTIPIDQLKKVNITDEQGELITSPALLDGLGMAIPQPTAADAKYLCWTVYHKRDFSVLPLT